MILTIILTVVVETITSKEESSIITFPTSFTGFDIRKKFNPDDVKISSFREGIKAVQSVAGILQNLFLEETINFAANNWIISPVSLAGVFAQLLMASHNAGEKNHTRLEIHRELGGLLQYFNRPQDNNNDYVLLLNSVVFLQPEFVLKPTYKHAIWDFYNTPVIPVDFT
ncbi:hypothetical protein Phum_PHUM108960 [Pediculus humanus corporis]|uniref:Serpin domain-containing protein n=1 Tax=Pediculus humanus subsp. corporis TaxID=121224 RepID=E0VDB2_PEDHC|nr:uncharacterized protein Phum_PHUM108960 [Pediculus humanus corporis]EEB11368.1 hypothetical protein Phum_PHUM108960 [Pediculus humanus corporis]